jgi:hypothetical protein
MFFLPSNSLTTRLELVAYEMEIRAIQPFPPTSRHDPRWANGADIACDWTPSESRGHERSVAGAGRGSVGGGLLP